MDLGTGDVRGVSDTNDDESPSFAPNGRYIIYATKADGRDVLMTTTTDGKFKSKLLETRPRHPRTCLGPLRPLIVGKSRSAGALAAMFIVLVGENR